MLPKQIMVVRKDLTAVARPNRATAADLPDFREKHLDQFLVDHCDLIADALRSGHAIGADSELHVIGRQVHRVDVLMAEVDGAGGEFRRLVLFENKLFANPEARRAVLAQIMEYADKLRDMEPEEVIDGFPCDAAWVQENQEDVARCLIEGDFLLVICCEDVREQTLALTRNFAQRMRNDPLCHYQLSVLSVAMFVHGEELLFVPHVVGDTTGVVRELTIRIRDANDAPVPRRRVMLEDGIASRGATTQAPEATVEEFLDSRSGVYDEVARAAYTKVFDALERSGITGVHRMQTRGGKPGVFVADSPVGSFKLFSMNPYQASLADSLHIVEKKALRGSAAGLTALMAFRQGLLSFEGAGRSPSGRVSVPLQSLAAGTDRFLSMVRTFVAELAACGKES